MVYITRALLHLVLIDQLGISGEIQRGVVQKHWGFSAAKFRDAVRDGGRSRLGFSYPRPEGR
jgi:hypothetical protein